MVLCVQKVSYVVMGKKWEPLPSKHFPKNCITHTSVNIICILDMTKHRATICVIKCCSPHYTGICILQI